VKKMVIVSELTASLVPKATPIAKHQQQEYLEEDTDNFLSSWFSGTPSIGVPSLAAEIPLIFG